MIPSSPTTLLSLLMLVVVVISGANATPAPSQPTKTTAAPPGHTFDMVVRCSAFNAEIVGFFAKCTGFPPRDFSVIGEDSSGCEASGDGAKAMQLVVATSAAAEKVRHLPRSVVTSFGIREMTGLAEKEQPVPVIVPSPEEDFHETVVASAKNKVNSQIIIGGVVGGVVALLLLMGTAVWYWRTKRSAQSTSQTKDQSQPLHTLDDDGGCWGSAELGDANPTGSTSKINPLYDDFL